MQNKIILNGLTIDEFKEMIEKSISQVLRKQELPIQDKEDSKEEYATRMEVAKLLKITLPTLHDWTKRGLLHSYKLGKRVLYRLNEVKEAMHKRNFSFERNGGSHA